MFSHAHMKTSEYPVVTGFLSLCHVPSNSSINQPRFSTGSLSASGRQRHILKNGTSYTVRFIVDFPSPIHQAVTVTVAACRRCSYQRLVPW